MYLIVYKINDWPDCGGGTYARECETKQECVDKINRLIKDYDHNTENIDFDVYEISKKLELVEKKYVLKYELK